MNWHSLSAVETAKKLNVDISTGLSDKEVSKRLKQYGKNELKDKKKKSVFIKFIEQFSDFMIIILILAAVISFLVSYMNGELDFVDPVIILFIITLNAILGVVQELKAEKSLEALKKMAAPTAKVRRNNIITVIPSSDIVPGDIIILEAGHYVPADARLLESNTLKAIESSLTGESNDVLKNCNTILSDNTLVNDRTNMVLATSIITYGRGSAIVCETGMNTQVGHIAHLISKDESPQTPLQKKLDKTSKTLGITALIICIAIFIMGVLKNIPLFDMFMTSVSLAVAAIPEGLPAIVTIMLSLGVQRMSKKNAIIRKLPAVETLGSATVICSDKTGTLTQNKMTVTEIASIKGSENLDSEFAVYLFTLAALCNDSQLNLKGKLFEATGEPTENALVIAAANKNLIKSELDNKYKRILEIPFDSTRKLMTSIHKLDNGKFRVITKGAPDVLLSKCSHYYDNKKTALLTDDKKRTIFKQNEQMADRALRVLAVAYKDLDSPPTSGNLKMAELGLCFVGLTGIIDPPRPEAKKAVITCKMAGIKPVMITGDHVLTASAIARELGIMDYGDKALTGVELNDMSDEILYENIYNYSVFARVSPEHKVRIVKAYQSHGEVVAMTRDGVNDAPALKSADIGCAMGISGTDVAKSTADMILTDDNFSTIVEAVREGRGIYENIKKSVHFLLSSNIGEIITIFTAILLGLPAPLVAVQLLWVNLVTDSLPAIALGVEPTHPDIMKKKPINPKKGLFSDGLGFKILFEGIMIGALSLIAFIIGRSFDEGNPMIGRTMAFAVLSLSQLFHSFNMRSDYSIFKIKFFSNPQLIFSFILCSLMQIGVISFKPIASIFQVTALDNTQWLIVALLSILPIILVELQKRAIYSENLLKYSKRTKIS